MSQHLDFDEISLYFSRVEFVALNDFNPIFAFFDKKISSLHYRFIMLLSSAYILLVLFVVIVESVLR